VTQEHTKPALHGYLPSLDGWRAVAILTVMAFHSQGSLVRAFGVSVQQVAGHMELLGPFGVDIFFAISGLLITSRLLAEEDRAGGISLKNFYIRRAFRILPPSLVYLGAVAGLSALGLMKFQAESWRAALLFSVNFVEHPWWFVGHFWSLAVEEHFYFLWPFLLVFVGRSRRLWVGLGMCGAVTAWRMLNIKFVGIGLAMGSAYFSHQGRTDFQVDGIFWGALAALAYPLLKDKAWVQRALSQRIGWMLFALAVGSLSVTADWKLMQGLLVFRRMAIPVVLLTTILHCDGATAWVLDSGAMRWIGKLSYSLYLWQQLFLVMGLEDRVHVMLPEMFPLNFVCAFGCAVLSYNLVEKPCIRMGHWMASRGWLAGKAEAVRDVLTA
jgi:peptidoglycan/LPS O-acetylase OafA/YrhL